MNINLYLKELKMNRLFFVFWTVLIAGLIFMSMGFYPAIISRDSIAGVKAIFENPMMKNMMAAFGTDIEMMSSPLGFYATYNNIFTLLLGCTFSILLASRILAREESEKTAEFLLAKPMTRLEILSSKFMVSVTYITIMNLILVSVGYISLEMFKGDNSYKVTSFLTLFTYCYLAMILFSAIGLCVSVFIPRGKQLPGLFFGIVFFAYFIEAVSKIAPYGDKFGYISPFKLVDAELQRIGYGLEMWRVYVLLSLTIILVILSYTKYRRKDILV